MPDPLAWDRRPKRVQVRQIVDGFGNSNGGMFNGNAHRHDITLIKLYANANHATLIQLTSSNEL